VKGERKGGRGEEGRGGERREGVRPLGRKKVGAYGSKNTEQTACRAVFPAQLTVSIKRAPEKPVNPSRFCKNVAL